MSSTISQIVADQLPESLRLEFKRSELVNNKRRDDICKAVSAMANSDGGRIIFGIGEDKAENIFRLDGGIADSARAIEWLDNIISDSIAPRISGFSISHESTSSASYLSIEVPRSTNAPHQAPDGRFYKRSNSRSFPMEAYEIDDIRNRRKAGPAPITVSFEIAPSSLAHMVIRNRSELVCRDLEIAVTSNFPMTSFGGGKTGAVKLSRIGIGQRVDYTLGSAHSIIGAAKDAAFHIQGSYFSEASSDPIQISDKISVGELVGSAIPHDEASEKLKKIADELRGVRDEIRKTNQFFEQMTETFAGSGVRISPLSLRQLRDSGGGAYSTGFKYDAYGLTFQGLAEVLETTTNVVAGLHRALSVIGGHSMLEGELDKLPPDVATCARLRLNFERY